MPSAVASHGERGREQAASLCYWLWSSDTGKRLLKALSRATGKRDGGDAGLPKIHKWNGALFSGEAKKGGGSGGGRGCHWGMTSWTALRQCGCLGPKAEQNLPVSTATQKGQGKKNQPGAAAVKSGGPSGLENWPGLPAPLPQAPAGRPWAGHRYCQSPSSPELSQHPLPPRVPVVGTGRERG